MPRASAQEQCRSWLICVDLRSSAVSSELVRMGKMIQLSAEGAKTKPVKLRSMMAAFDGHTGGCLGCPPANPRFGCLSLRCLLLDLYCDTNARRSRRQH